LHRNTLALLFGSTSLALSCCQPLAAQPALTAQTNHSSTNTFALGETVSLDLRADGLAPNASTGLEIFISDEQGHALAHRSTTILADGAGHAQIELPAPADHYGYYEVKATLANGTALPAQGTRPAGILSYAVVPDPAKRTDYGPEKSHFGFQGGYNDKAPVLRYLGAHYFHGGGGWIAMEPSAPGQFTPRTGRIAGGAPGKPWVHLALQDGSPQQAPWHMYAISTVTNAGIPAWALEAGTQGKVCKGFGALNSAGRQAFPGFAGRLAQEFAAVWPDTHPRIYQVTWEPGKTWCFGGTPDQLVAYYALAYDAIHKADTEALVAGPTLFMQTASANELDGLLAAGLGRYLDVLSIHPYVMPNDIAPEKAQFLPLLHRQLAAVQKAKGHPVPFIGTENGYESDYGGLLEQARRDLRVTLMMLGEGARFDFGFYVHDFWDAGHPTQIRSFGYYWNLNPRVPFGSDMLSPKPVAPAYAVMSWLLDGSQAQGPASGLSGTQVGYRFLRAGQQTEVVWDYGNGSTLAVPAGAKVLNWMGNPVSHGKTIDLTGSPVYLLLAG